MTQDRRPAILCRHPSSAAWEYRPTKIIILLVLGLLGGCASVYFHDAGTQPAQALRYSLAELPFSEYWTGIVFNGDKIGYARFNLRPAPAGRHEIVSEASFVLRFLGIEKKVHLRGRDVVNDGQLQKLATVEQRVEAYEKSRFFPGDAFKVTTTSHDQRTTTWIDALGRPVFELAMRGVMIAALEDEARARQYVALAAVNQRESLVEFSLIRPDRPLAQPRRVAYMKVVL